MCQTLFEFYFGKDVGSHVFNVVSVAGNVAPSLPFVVGRADAVKLCLKSTLEWQNDVYSKQ